ncbi:MAG: transcription antitermination factor NusB [Pseudomonadota bacterium]
MTAAAGLTPRAIAVEAFRAITDRREPLDAAFPDAIAKSGETDIPARDRALARLILLAGLRRAGSLTALVESYLETGIPPKSGPLRAILVLAAAQLILIRAPAHAVINVAVTQCQKHPRARRFSKLSNAVLRRLSETGDERFAALDACEHDIPAWFLDRWTAAYGAETARAIATASLAPADLDITPKSPERAEAIASALSATVLPTGSLRLAGSHDIAALDGFKDGAWWVQDVAATLPARILINAGNAAAGARTLDVCAAPGGKTMQLAAAGLDVTALDRSAKRLVVLQSNLDRVGLTASIATADARTWEPETLFDGVLLDAPCSATGTLRRHPDILHVRTQDDVRGLVALQAELLAHSARFVRAGGTLVYCTCSLETDEGPDQVAAFLEAHPEFETVAIDAAALGVPADWMTTNGALRTLPHFAFAADAPMPGIDGFYAAALRKRSI